MSGSVPPKQFVFEVSPETPIERLDAFLSKQTEELSRSRVKSLIANGCVSVTPASQKAIKASMMIASGQTWVIELPPAQASDLVPEELPLSILYEDEDIIVVNKAAHMVVHPGAGQPQGTLANALRFHFPDIQIGDAQRPGLVHRLDKETSGVMVVARNAHAHRVLSEAFAHREIQKKYLAFCYGRPKSVQFSLQTGHLRHDKDRRRYNTRLPPPEADDEMVRFAHTDFHVQGFAHGVSLVEAVLHTGRTHQIRAHLADHGHPILMDAIYGGLKPEKRIGQSPVRQAAVRLERQALHAAVLGFKHPKSGENCRFEAPCPEDLLPLQKAILDANSL